MNIRMLFCCFSYVCCLCYTAKAQVAKPQLMIPTGHPQGIIKLSLIQGKQVLVSQSYNERAVRLWDLKTSKLLRVLRLPEQPENICINENTGQILFNLYDSAAFVYDIEKDGPSFKLPTSFGTTFYSSNEKSIIGITKNSVHLFDGVSGKLLATQVFKDSIKQLIPLPNSKKYMCVTKHNNELLHMLLDSSLQPGKPFFSCTALRPTFVVTQANNIGIFQFSDSSSIKYTFNNKFQLIEKHQEDSVYGQPVDMVFDAKTGMVSFAMNDTTVAVFDNKGRWKYWLANFPTGIKGMLFCNGGKNFLVKTNMEIINYNASDGVEIMQLDLDSTVTNIKNIEGGFCFNPKNNRFYFVLNDNYIYECEANNKAIVVNKKIKGLTKGVDKIIAENGAVVFGSSDGLIKEIDLVNVSIKDFHKVHNSFLTSFIKQDDLYLTTSWDSSINVWNKNGMKLVHTKKLNDRVLDGCLSKDSQVLAIKGVDNKKETQAYNSYMLLYNLKNPNKEIWKKFENHVSAATFMNGNKPVLAFDEDSIIQLFSDTAASIKTIKSTGWIVAMEYRHQNNMLFALTYTHVEVYDSSLLLVNKVPIYNANGAGGFDANPKANRFLLANMDGTIEYYSTTENKSLFSVKAYNDGSQVKFTSDSTCITISESGIIKYWKLNDASFSELCTIIPFDNGEYVTMLPSVYYKGSKKGAASLHYVTKDLKVITFEQLDIRYNRPDKVMEAIGSRDTALISSYHKAYTKRIRKIGIDTASFTNSFNVPEADYANRNEIRSEQNHNKLRLRIKATDKNFKLQKFNIWVNEVPVFGLLGRRVKQSHSLDTTIAIILSTGENSITVSAMNDNGTESYRRPLLVKYTPLKKKQHKVYFIGIGINQFANPAYNLNWSVKDIRDLATKFKNKYPKIIIDTLFDKDVTKPNILALKQKLLQLNEDDRVIVSYSGHGLLSKSFDYYLSTYTVNFNNPEAKGLEYDDLESLLDNIKPRQKLMLIDACHSGEIDKEELAKIETAKKELNKNGITIKSTIKVVPKKKIGMANSFELMQNLFVNVSKGTGATIISAAGGMQYAQERGDLKNGVFTYSIIEAMNNNGTITVSQLKNIVGERVLQLTNGLQKPTSRNETNNYDWTVW